MGLNSNKNLLFQDNGNNIITSQERIDELYRNNLKFEAAIVQASVIEALLFFLVLLNATERNEDTSEQIRNGLSRLTMGGLIRRAESHELVDGEILSEISELRNDRNTLVHKHLPQLNDFDMDVFYEKGKELTKTLHQLVREKAAVVMSRS